MLVKLTNACDQPTKRPADDVEICWSKSQSVVNTDYVMLKVPDCKIIIPEAKWIVKSNLALEYTAEVWGQALSRLASSQVRAWQREIG